eukprot:TRINITY_DN23913_c0_g1_i1.p1 TRINITY_DN23913_c0_g1~~TRINITY_DN23913_c0_g1_i1.p1  ORF type:complete len:274 (-),score=43.57 TRINITY_DN23913_c0_g1_i1:22-843(-)
MEQQRRFSSKYGIIGRIADGTNGSVVRVQRFDDMRVFACKILKYDERDDRAIQLLVNEVNLLSQLRRKQFIVRYEDHFADAGRHVVCIITDLYNGGDLKTALVARARSKKHMTEPTVWKAISQLLQALVCCHAEKIVHRDIKSGNIVLDSNGNMFLADFGYACTSSGPLTLFCGTPYYSAPEIHRCLPYTEKVDIWSMGIVFYEMCALALPFQEKSMDALKNQIAKGQFDRIPALYSDDLQNLIVSMLSVDPASRPNAARLLDIVRSIDRKFS